MPQEIRDLEVGDRVFEKGYPDETGTIIDIVESKVVDDVMYMVKRDDRVAGMLPIGYYADELERIK